MSSKKHTLLFLWGGGGLSHARSIKTGEQSTIDHQAMIQMRDAVPGPKAMQSLVEL